MTPEYNRKKREVCINCLLNITGYRRVLQKTFEVVQCSMVTSRYTIKLLPHYLLSLYNVIVYVARQCLRYLGISDTDLEYMWGWGGWLH